MARIDFFTGIGLMILAVAVYIGTLDMIQVEKGIGPGDYPRVVAAGIFLLGAIQAIRAGFSLSRKAKDASPGLPPTARKRVVIMVLLVFAYLAVMPYTGFVLVTPIFLFTAMTFFGLRKRLVGVLSSIGITLTVFFTFRYAFQVLLPVIGLFGYF